MDFEEVNLNEVGVKAQSKGELYRLLTVEGGLYLPPQDQTNLDFISDICFKEKKAFKASDIKVCTLPHVKGLRSEDLIRFIVEECDAEAISVSSVLVESFIGNTLEYDVFQQMIKQVLKEREEDLLKKKNLSINISRDIASVFKDSQMVSVSKGKSHKLLRKHLLRKEKEVQLQKHEELKEAAQNSEKLKMEIDILKQQLEEQQRRVDDHVGDSEILKELFRQGVIDSDGRPTHLGMDGSSH